MLTVTNAITHHRLPFISRQDVSNHPSMNTTYANAFPLIQPYQKYIGGTSLGLNHQLTTELPPISFQAFIPATNRVLMSVAASHGQRVESQILTPFIDHTPSQPQGIVVHDIPFGCHLNSSTMAQMAVTSHQKINVNMDTTVDGLEHGNLTISTPPAVGDMSGMDRLTNDTISYPTDSVQPHFIQNPPPRHRTQHCVRDADNNNGVAPSPEEFGNEMKMINDKTVPNAISPHAVISSENFIPVYTQNINIVSDRLASNTKSPVSSSPKPTDKRATPEDSQNSHEELQGNTYNGDISLESLDKRGFKEFLETEQTEMTLEESNQPRNIRTLEGKKMLSNSVCSDSVNGLFVKSLRHSIESILTTTSPRKRERNERDAERQEMPDQVGGQGAHDYIGRREQNDIKAVKRNTCTGQKDQYDEDAICIISARADKELCDEKGDTEIDVISCAETENLFNTLLTSEKYSETHSSTSDNRSPLPCSQDNVKQPELLMDDIEIMGKTPDQNQQKSCVFKHLKTNRQNDENAEPSQLLMSKHLEGLEGFIAKEDADHFQKDEFFQAKMQVLHSVSRTCKMTSTHQQVSADQETSRPRSPTRSMTLAPIATIPPFPLMPSTDEASDIPNCSSRGMCHQYTRTHFMYNQYCFPCKTKEPTVHYADQVQGYNSEVLKKDLQRSAFKPIVKRCHSSHMISSHASCQSEENPPTTPALLNCHPINPSIRIPVAMLIPSSDGMKFPKFVSTVSKVNALDESVNLDAISLLRFKSKNYQSSGSQDSSFTYSPTAQPNPEAVTMWFSWLRNRNLDAMRSDPVLSKVPPPPRYHCGDCNKTYSTFGGLSKHRQFHCARHVKKEFACKICTKSYSSLGALKMHIRTHTLPCKCHLCGKAFSRPWLLQGHVRTHTGEKPFRCNHCGRAFADRSNLRAHLQTHAEIKKYACVKCGKTFSRMSLLTKHSDGSCPANASQGI